MRELTREARQEVDAIARRHGFGFEATTVMLDAVLGGRGSMAQFSHAEFGGHGQWMRGGMTMVGDMFNHRLKDRVDALCVDLADLVARQPNLVVDDAPAPRPGGGNWWPGDFGAPDASGSQNNSRYAYFAGPRRLVVDTGGQVRVHDTQDHRIGGVSQQQSSGSRLAFTSQHGTVDLTSLPVVSERAESGRGPALSAAVPQPPTASPADRSGQGRDDVYTAIEKLAALHAKGILSDDEFSATKAELLRRV